MSASLRDQRFARALDREIAPVYHDRFGRVLLRALPRLEEGTILEVHCGTGRLAERILERSGSGVRLLGMDDDPAQLAFARTRIRPQWRERVYFQPGDLDDVAEMDPDAYDLTVANLLLGAREHDWKAGLRGLLRVTKPGGTVLATIPLRGSWSEPEDVFAEVLREDGRTRALDLLARVQRLRPRASGIAEALRAMGISADDFVVEHEPYQLLFRSGREFLFAPVVEHGALPLWKAIAGDDRVQELFWSFKEALDTYHIGRVLAVTMIAGLIRVQRPAGSKRSAAASLAASHWARYPELARAWSQETKGADADDMQIEVEMDLDVDVETPDAKDDEDDAWGTGDEDDAFERMLEDNSDEAAAVRNVLQFAEAHDSDMDEELLPVPEVPASGTRSVPVAAAARASTGSATALRGGASKPEPAGGTPAAAGDSGPVAAASASTSSASRPVRPPSAASPSAGESSSQLVRPSPPRPPLPPKSGAAAAARTPAASGPAITGHTGPQTAAPMTAQTTTAERSALKERLAALGRKPKSP